MRCCAPIFPFSPAWPRPAMQPPLPRPAGKRAHQCFIDHRLQRVGTRNQDAVTAMLASFLALVRNLPMMLVWAALIVALTAVGVATAFIGLVFLMPLVGHATWHAYRALIDPLPA